MKELTLRRCAWMFAVLALSVGAIAVLCFRAGYKGGFVKLRVYLRSTEVRELPAELVPQAFRYFTGWSLPSKAENLRAVVQGGRGARGFISFSTDSDGREYALRAFVVAYAEYRPIDPNELHEAAALGSGIFPTVAYWEREYGYSLFDEETIGPGYILSARFGPQVLIDEQHDKVYVYASHPFGGTAGKSATAAEAHDGNRETGGNRGQSRMAVP